MTEVEAETYECSEIDNLYHSEMNPEKCATFCCVCDEETCETIIPLNSRMCASHMSIVERIELYTCEEQFEYVMALQELMSQFPNLLKEKTLTFFSAQQPDHEGKTFFCGKCYNYQCHQVISRNATTCIPSHHMEE